jgi:hypothetical protein
MKHGRWLQRDPLGFIDGPNLYEAFGGNALVNLDPEGEGILCWLMRVGYQQSDWQFMKDVGSSFNELNVKPLQKRSEERFLLMYVAQQNGDQRFQSDAGIMVGGVLLALGDILPSGKLAEAGTGISTGRFEAAGSRLGGGTRALRGGVAAGETVLWVLFSTQGGQATEGLLARSGAVRAAELRFFQATGGSMRLGLLNQGSFFAAAAESGNLFSAGVRNRLLVDMFESGLNAGIAQYAAQTPQAAASRAAVMYLTDEGAIVIAAPSTGATASAGMMPEGQSIILRPIEIQFPAAGLSPVQQQLFAAHLAEQEAALNQLSLLAPADLELNLLNYRNIRSQVASSRGLARQYLSGAGTGLHAAHRLDAVAGGYIHDFAGLRDPVQSQIGALWPSRVIYIVPGREHRLVPQFQK